MSPRRRAYLLTPTARRHLREARNWSLQHWGEDLTRQYFKDLDAGVRELAANHTRYRHREELAGGTGLRLHPIREHYIVFEPLSKNQIVVVAVLRRGVRHRLAF